MTERNVYGISDQHFFHKNIIEYCNRPFEKSEDGIVKSIELMVNRYNEVVNDDDIVLWVGDVSLHRSHQSDFVKSIIRSCKGYKILIKGNHDKEPNAFYESVFDEVHDEFIYANGHIICHYPITPSEYSRRSELRVIDNIHRYVRENMLDIKSIIHGHTHEKDANYYAKDGIPRINVCVDFPDNDYRPVLLEEVKDYFCEKISQ